ncbi:MULTISPECIES: hypothetical protein [Nocardia]|uniref:hypothetical protein n=1 Tax=Nocardia TaxID=1817 RepID=UPI000D68CB1A|nr:MULTISPECIES: hypothetical protein [Nocardia]
MIVHATDLLAWIEANLPALDAGRYHPWSGGPTPPGALTAQIEVTITSPGHEVRRVCVRLSAEPLEPTTPSPRRR